MHRKMTEKTVTLTGGKGQPRFLHVVEHLREQPEIKAARPMILVVQTADNSHKESKTDYKHT